MTRPSGSENRKCVTLATPSGDPEEDTTAETSLKIEMG